MSPRMLATLLFAHPLWANADIYLHNPAGSNNRNRERTDNRQNANRLFDSQNNDKGGYPWRGDRTFQEKPDPLVYYSGSILRLEWTNQHACGNDPTTHCSMVLQYACDDSLPNIRDGYPSGKLQNSPNNNNLAYNPVYQEASFLRNKKDGTTTIDEGTKDDIEYGMHENFDYYSNCLQRTRNKGLYTADRQINDNLGATGTRQQPTGTRYGFECNEERDYYPYWSPSPWRDIAVLVSDESWCPYYQKESQNVKPRFNCTNIKDPANGEVPIDMKACKNAGGTWTEQAAWGIDAPECKLHPRSRQNHLGNVAGTDADGLPDTAHYDWHIPHMGGSARTCVVRIRYNISTADYDSYAGFTVGSDDDDSEVFGSEHNCYPGSKGMKPGCTLQLGNEVLPLTNRPYIKPESGSNLQLGIAINTDQNARTFQDRSHVFSISPRPSQVGDKKIYNVNTRGRRGNIVQAYPAVEYDFVPQELTVEQGDYLHIQWSGSDFNAPKNPNNAEGWEYSDRHNMVQIRDLNTQFPIPFDKQNFFQSTAQAHRFAWVDTDTTLQSLVDPQTGNNYECRQIPASKPPAQTNTESAQVQNDPLNCGKLNWAPARFDGGLMYVQQKPGNYYFTSTRDNNFSNRSPKWNLKINPGQLKSQNHSLVAVAIGISITILVFGLGGLAVVYYLRKARRRDNDHTDRSEYNALKQPVGKSNTRRPDRV